MKTGRYRLRRGFNGTAVLQYEYSSPSFIAGQVDASIRQIVWQDVNYDDLANIAVTLDERSKP